MQKFTEWQDSALNGEYPPDPKPWQRVLYEAFDSAVLEIFKEVRICLGSNYRVFYNRLGNFDEPEKTQRASQAPLMLPSNV